MKDDTKQEVTEKLSAEITKEDVKNEAINNSSEQETQKMNVKSSEESTEEDVKEVTANNSSEQPTQKLNEISSEESIENISSIEETDTCSPDHDSSVEDMKDDTKQEVTEKLSAEITK